MTEMKFKFSILIILSCFVVYNSSGQQGIESQIKSIRSFGVLPENSAHVNKANLQKAIDWAVNSGAALMVEPSEKPYEIESGIVLKKTFH